LQKAEAAQNRFEKIFSQKQLSGEMPILEAAAGLKLLELVLVAKPDLSKSAARRLIEQNAVAINQEICHDWDKTPAYSSGDTLKIGKHEFWKIK
jgi:tyrosyl-tRNA synthetase